jgi:hypothetical protein
MLALRDVDVKRSSEMDKDVHVSPFMDNRTDCASSDGANQQHSDVR